MNLYENSVRLMVIVLLTSIATYAFADKSSKSSKSPKTFQSAEMINLVADNQVAGGGVLYRGKNTVRARLSTTGLDTNASYTVWWIVFNKPSNCYIEGCSADDIFSGGGLNESQIALAEISVFYADGFVTGADGIGNVTAHLDAGKLPDGVDVLFGWKEGKSGLKKNKGNKAEIHMVVRTHGPSLGGMVGFQTSNFDADCTACADQQAIVFIPL